MGLSPFLLRLLCCLDRKKARKGEKFEEEKKTKTDVKKKLAYKSARRAVRGGDSRGLCIKDNMVR